MKNKKKKTTFFIFSLFMSISILACSETDNYVVDKTLNVVIEKCDHCSFETTTYKIDEKNDLLINMNIDDGYYVESINYDNSTITTNENNVSILLKDIRYDLRLKIQVSKYPYIHIVENDNYVTETYNYVLKDAKELNFSITVNEDKELVSCSYSDCDLVNLNDNIVNVHLFNIHSDTEVSFAFEEKKYAEAPEDITDENERYMYALMPRGKNNTKYIYYCLNGGVLIDDETEEYGFYKKVDVTNHPRPNTDIGTSSMKRDGYHLECWNTKRDGSGTRIGLGSRFTMDNYNIVLFAQWKKETPVSSFNYKVVNGEVTITGLKNASTSIGEIIFPNYIGNYKVTNIDKYAFVSVEIQSLYLPLYLSNIEYFAFTSCTIKTLHFYDSVFFYQYAFEKSSVETVYINAVEKPRYCKNEFSCFADKIDRLILNNDEKRLILYGGCNLSYGIYSADLAAEFCDYTIFNMGIVGGTNSGFQMDLISRYVKEGDLIIHAPEPMSAYQLMHYNSCEVRIFYNLESNYDLLALLDITKFGYFFNSYHDYSVSRRNLEPCKYEDYCDHYNEYGDIIDDLEVQYGSEKLRRNEYGKTNFDYEETESVKFEFTFVHQMSMDLLESYYNLFVDKGAEVVFSYAPINKDSLGEKETEEKSWLIFEARINEFLSYPIISNVEDYLYPSEYFLDTNYHLNLFGAKLRTAQLISDLKNYFDGITKN